MFIPDYTAKKKKLWLISSWQHKTNWLSLRLTNTILLLVHLIFFQTTEKTFSLLHFFHHLFQTEFCLKQTLLFLEKKKKKRWRSIGEGCRLANIFSTEVFFFSQKMLHITSSLILMKFDYSAGSQQRKWLTSDCASESCHSSYSVCKMGKTTHTSIDILCLLPFCTNRVHCLKISCYHMRQCCIFHCTALRSKFPLYLF